MISSEEFVVGKHGIRWVSSDFTSVFGARAFNKRGMGTFQKLPKLMTDSQIEQEMKPGICALGDVLAFCDSAGAECKDGWWNLFYFPDRVVSVRWGDGGWYVGCWRRGGGRWGAGSRVFSPATDSSDTGTVEADLKPLLDVLVELVHIDVDQKLASEIAKRQTRSKTPDHFVKQLHNARLKSLLQHIVQHLLVDRGLESSGALSSALDTVKAAGYRVFKEV